MMTLSNARASTIWIVLLSVASTVTTLALACATPFQALAALAATQMRKRDGVLLVLACWVASQAVGFGLLQYPPTLTTFGWGLAMGMAAVASVIVARWAVRWSGAQGEFGQIVIGYVAATIAFKAAILLWSLGLGGVATALSPSINARQFVRNGAILAGLLLFHRALIALGLPRVASGKRWVTA